MQPTFFASSFGHWLIRALWLAGVAATAGAVWWVWSSDAVPTVPLYETGSRPVPVRPEGKPLRVLVASMVSPQSTLDRYRELVALLAKLGGRQAQLQQRKSYFDANTAILNDETDLAFVCTGAYVQMSRLPRAPQPIAVPVVGGETIYRAVLIVRSDDSAADWPAIRGRKMAFVDPLSLTGHLWARNYLHQQATTEEAYFASTIYAGSHDRAIEAVADGLADAATVDELVLRGLKRSRPDVASRVKVIVTSEGFGIPPVVIPAARPAAERERWTAALLSLHTTEEGRRTLAALNIDRFVALPPGHFESAARIIEP
ncbi:MAG: PhnD/SsuA/transferrin family substrate-binding protein [Deltaproteobacteria bacterium]|nr:PhnD/SsuA/transferrin family substrate-binding protein [Deltaproteobacteria bacterium]